MANQRQQKLARQIANNILLDKPKNAQQLLEDSGYTTTTARASAKVIIQGKGVQKELLELGFSIENAKRVIGAILNSPTIFEMVTPENQIRAAQEVFKVTGEYAQSEEGNKTLIINITGETAERYGLIKSPPKPEDNCEG